MKKLLTGIIVIAMVGLVASGCGGSGQGGGGEKNKPDVPARTIKDGAEKYDQFQGQCPVCRKPIRADFHAQVEYDGKSGRIYFDKKECEEKFKKNPEKYMKNYRSPMESAGQPQGAR